MGGKGAAEEGEERRDRRGRKRRRRGLDVIWEARGWRDKPGKLKDLV